jgi:hypothetical protein
MTDPIIYGLFFGGLFVNVFDLFGNKTHLIINYQVMNNSVTQVDNYIVEATNIESTHVI